MTKDFDAILRNFEARFECPSRLLRDERTVLDEPFAPREPPAKTAYIYGSNANRVKPVRAKRGTFKRKRPTRYLNAEQSQLPCESTGGAHKWQEYEHTGTGTCRLARCMKCFAQTSDRNAGLREGIGKRASVKLVPFRDLPPCPKAKEHGWLRNGSFRGKQKIICHHCGRQSRTAEAVAC